MPANVLLVKSPTPMKGTLLRRILEVYAFTAILAQEIADHSARLHPTDAPQPQRENRIWGDQSASESGRPWVLEPWEYDGCWT